MAFDMSSTERAMTRRRRIHPLTWVAAAALLPLVCWDAWQTQHEVRAKRAASVVGYAQSQTHPLAPQARSRYRPW